MNLTKLFAATAGIVGLGIMSGVLAGIPTLVVLSLLKWFGVI